MLIFQKVQKQALNKEVEQQRGSWLRKEKKNKKKKKKTCLFWALVTAIDKNQ